MSVTVVSKKSQDLTVGHRWDIAVRGARADARVEVDVTAPDGAAYRTIALPGTGENASQHVASFVVDRPGDFTAALSVDGDPIADFKATATSSDVPAVPADVTKV